MSEPLEAFQTPAPRASQPPGAELSPLAATMRLQSRKPGFEGVYARCWLTFETTDIEAWLRSEELRATPPDFALEALAIHLAAVVVAAAGNLGFNGSHKACALLLMQHTVTHARGMLDSHHDVDMQGGRADG